MPDNKSNKKSFGYLGEQAAINLLKKSGYKIIERNFYSTIGEIDLIAIDNNTLVFVEVKIRRSRKYGKPEEAVTPKKLFRIKRTGDYYLKLNPNSPKKHRVDVVAIEVKGNKIASSKIIKVI